MPKDSAINSRYAEEIIAVRKGRSLEIPGIFEIESSSSSQSLNLLLNKIAKKKNGMAIRSNDENRIIKLGKARRIAINPPAIVAFCHVFRDLNQLTNLAIIAPIIDGYILNSEIKMSSLGCATGTQNPPW